MVKGFKILLAGCLAAIALLLFSGVSYAEPIPSMHSPPTEYVATKTMNMKHQSKVKGEATGEVFVSAGADNSADRLAISFETLSTGNLVAYDWPENDQKGTAATSESGSEVPERCPETGMVLT